MTVFGAVETYALRIEYDAKELTRLIELVNQSPDFRLMAEANLERAERALKEGLAVVKSGMDRIERKRRPVNQLMVAAE